VNLAYKGYVKGEANPYILNDFLTIPREGFVNKK
jgi:hypothetical protein